MKILIAGDFAPRCRVSQLIERKEYKSIFGNIRDFIIEENDYSIVNLESPIVLGNAKPIRKTGPNLKAPIEVLDAITYAGFNGVTLANNHFYDYGEVGVNDTIKSCISKHVDFVGGGSSIEKARKILYKNIANKKVAFVNFCENEWSIASDKNGGSAPLKLVDNYYDIVDAKKNADYVIVIVHGGKEYYQLPLPRMQKTYRFFVDIGADFVVNHHQHCFSGYEKYNGKYIFYGLGNFCFDADNKRNGMWNEGFLLQLIIEDSISFKLIPYIQCNNIPQIEPMQDKKRDAFFHFIEELNTIISDEGKLEHEFFSLVNENNRMLNFLEPYDNRILMALRSRHMLPSFLTRRKKDLILNLFRCETHRDVLLNLLK